MFDKMTFSAKGKELTVGAVSGNENREKKELALELTKELSPSERVQEVLRFRSSPKDMDDYREMFSAYSSRQRSLQEKMAGLLARQKNILVAHGVPFSENEEEDGRLLFSGEMDVAQGWVKELLIKVEELDDCRDKLHQVAEHLQFVGEMLSSTPDLAKMEDFFKRREEKGENDITFVVKNAGRIVASASVQLTDNKLGKLAYCHSRLVDEAYRGQALDRRLRVAIEKFAQDNNCAFVAENIYVDNPIAIVAAVKAKMALVSVQYNRKTPAFYLLKLLNGLETHYDKRVGALGELVEVPLTDISEIDKYLKAGWIGIDIKNIESARDNTPNNWILILEKNG